jgi:hypothetical protein
VFTPWTSTVISTLTATSTPFNQRLPAAANYAIANVAASGYQGHGAVNAPPGQWWVTSSCFVDYLLSIVVSGNFNGSTVDRNQYHAQAPETSAVVPVDPYSGGPFGWAASAGTFTSFLNQLANSDIQSEDRLKASEV